MQIEIPPVKYKQVEWLGLTLFIESHHRYVAASSAGWVCSYQDMPVLWEKIWYNASRGGFADVCKVDLEDTNWQHTLVEYPL